MHKFDIHAVSIVAEDFNLILIHDIATVASDEVLAKLVLNSLGGATQHIVAQLAICLIINLHIVVLRLYIVEAIDADTHLQAACAIDKMNELRVGIIGLIVDHIHTDTVEQSTLMAIDSLLCADDIGHDDDK